MSNQVDYLIVPTTRPQGRALTGSWEQTDKIVLYLCLLASAGMGTWLGILAGYSFMTGTLTGLVVMLLLWGCFLHRGNGESYGRNYHRIAIWFASRTRTVWWSATSERYGEAVIPLENDYVVLDGMDKDRDRVALLHHVDRNYDQLYVLARGGAAAANDPYEQSRLRTQLREIFDRVVSLSDLQAGIAVLRVMAPANFAGVQEYVAAFGSPMVFVEDAFTLGPDDTELNEWCRQMFSNQLEEARRWGGTDNSQLIVVTIKRDSAWSKVDRATKEELYDLPVIELGRSLVDGLVGTSLELHDVHMLQPHELFLLCREAWDVYGIGDFHQKYAEIVAQHADEADVLMDTLSSELSCWPETIIESHSDEVIQMDNNWITTLWVTQLPERIRDDVSLSLHYIPQPDMWLRRCCGGEATSGVAESKSLRFQRAGLMGIENAYFSNSLLRPESIEEREKHLIAQSEVLKSVIVAQRSNEYWTVIAPDRRTLRRHVKHVRSSLRKEGWVAQPVRHKSLHLDAVLTGALGALRL